jgi:hypothetical protein
MSHNQQVRLRLRLPNLDDLRGQSRGRRTKGASRHHPLLAVIHGTSMCPEDSKVDTRPDQHTETLEIPHRYGNRYLRLPPGFA